jgi:hypothetical protein
MKHKGHARPYDYQADNRYQQPKQYGRLTPHYPAMLAVADFLPIHRHEEKARPKDAGNTIEQIYVAFDHLIHPFLP